MEGIEKNRTRGGSAVGARIDRASRARDPRLQGHGDPLRRLRQQHPPGGQGRGPEERVRLSRLRPCLHSADVLRREGSLPLGGAVGRPCRHRADRRQDERSVLARQSPAPLARPRREKDPFSGPAGANLLARARRAPSRGPRLQRDGAKRGAEGADRHRPRPPRCGIGGQPQPRDRGDEGRLGCRVRLGLPQRVAQLRERRDLGVDPPRRRRRHGLFAACRHGDRLRRQRCGGEADRARPVERPGERRDAPCRRRLPGGSTVRTAQPPRSADARVIGLGKQQLSLSRLRTIAREGPPLELDPACLAALRAGLAAVERIVASGRAAYGINTGFGRLSQTRIPVSELEQLQTNIVLSHAAGTGPLLDDAAVRLTIALKVESLARGYSGVRPQLVDLLLGLYNQGIYPLIPAKGSVGASGDLAPLAHLSLALLGIGEVRVAGRLLPARQALGNAGLEPIKLAPKEGLALLNGTQVSTALALLGLFAAEDVFAAAVAAGALSVDAAAGSDTPRVFPQGDEVVSGGNFHAEPVALAADALAVAIAETGALAERRIALLIDPTLSGLPPFLVQHGGVNSGFMVAQVTAAALASENKSLAHPASVDSLPTSANQEDHVSMATFAARRLGDMAANSAGIVAIELLAAAQGIDFRAPLKTSPRLQEVHALVRSRVGFYAHDRYFAPDITAIQALVEAGAFHRFAPGLLPSQLP